MPQFPQAGRAIPPLPELAEAELWIAAIWLRVNPEQAEALVLGRGRVLKDWNTAPAPSIKRLPIFSLQVV